MTRRALAEEVYRLLRAALLAGRFAPGARLNLDQLARTFRVSNTPVRGALTRLAGEGLVTNEPFRGFRVSHLVDRRGIAELYEYRLLIEPPAAAAASRGVTSAQEDELAALADPGRDRGPEALAVRDAAFHHLIAVIAGNRVLADALEQALRRARLHEGYAVRQAVELTAAEHRRIARAIIEGHPGQARDATREHLLRGRERLLTRFCGE